MGEVLDAGGAVHVFGALAHPIRLAVVRLLRRAPAGLSAGQLATALDVAASTLSTHLSTLERAGLIRSKRHGRSLVYRAVSETVDALRTFIDGLDEAAS